MTITRRVAFMVRLIYRKLRGDVFVIVDSKAQGITTGSLPFAHGQGRISRQELMEKVEEFLQENIGEFLKKEGGKPAKMGGTTREVSFMVKLYHQKAKNWVEVTVGKPGPHPNAKCKIFNYGKGTMSRQTLMDKLEMFIQSNIDDILGRTPEEVPIEEEK